MPIAEHFLSKGKKVTIFTSKGFRSLWDNHPAPGLKIRSKDSIWLRIVKLVFKKQYFDLKFEKYPIINVQDALGKLCAIQNYHPPLPKFYLSEKEKMAPKNHPYVLLHLETFKGMKFRDTHGINWEKLTVHLNNLGYKVYELAINPKDCKVAEHLPTKDLRSLIRAIYHCSIFIGLDSAPAHIAVSFKKPSHLLFGSVIPALRHKPQENLFTYHGHCHLHGCFHQSYLSGEKPSCKLYKASETPVCAIHDTYKILKDMETYTQHISPILPEN